MLVMYEMLSPLMVYVSLSGDLISGWVLSE